MDETIPPENKPDLSKSTDNVLPEQIQYLRLVASRLLHKAEKAPKLSEMADAIEKATGALNAAAEMDKMRGELAKLDQETSQLKYQNLTAAKRERSERIKDYVTLLAPLITIVTLAATLLAQSWQFLRSERNKREEIVDAQWQDAVKTISTTGAFSPGVIALQPFLRSPKYAENAREVAVNLLANSSDRGFFTTLFGVALTPVTWSNLDRSLRLDRSLSARIIPVRSRAWDRAKLQEDKSRLTKEELATYDYVETALPVITSHVGSVLKTERPSGTRIDLSGTVFKNGDWQRVDLNGANLENADLFKMNLRDAQLDGITQFAGAWFYGTNWWDAESISKPLLEYLQTKWPCYPYQPYGPQDQVCSEEDCKRSITRLTLQSR
jgi:hypothetical protein